MFDPVALVTACKCLNLEFPVNCQNDASEFFEKLVDSVDEALQRCVHLLICLDAHPRLATQSFAQLACEPVPQRQGHGGEAEAVPRVLDGC